MLQLSEAAVSAIGELAGDGGLRFVAREIEGGFEFEPSLADQPEDGDVVVESGGARVFLDAGSAERLDDQILDVESHGDHVHFSFSPQGESGPADEED
jgi:Fe-S cluster assembly iron-binding protein IscA